MRVTITIASILLLAASLPTPATAADNTAAVEKEITRIEHEFVDAILKADVAVFDRYTDPDWTFTTPSGEVWNWAKTSGLVKTGGLKTTAMKIDELRVKVYGDTAIAFILDTETTTVNGKDVSGQYRGTDVFVKRDGKWKVVASHGCKVEK